MAKKVCPECAARGDRASMKPMLNESALPIWGCFLCAHTMPRRVLNTKKRRERQERFERIAASLEGGAQ